MLPAEHYFACKDTLVTTSMHRRSGSQRESFQAAPNGAVYQLNNMCKWLREESQSLLEQPLPAWTTTLAQRGFKGAIRHFVYSVSNLSAPETAGEQAFAAQRMIERLLRDHAM